ncbi:MAG: hypothetical protein HGB11_15785 [Chlorobiales bacterium]|nr:hypothetical protein [Chlorobiales bacterium]
MNHAELNEFCRRWLEKADAYDSSALSGAFDSFSSTFVAYNALYNEVARLLVKSGVARHQDTGDKRSATVHVPAFLGYRDLAHMIKSKPELIACVQEITRLIKYGSFYIHSDKTGRPNYAADRECLRHLELGNDEEFCEALMMLIYITRCNMFHGSKEFHPIQASLLNPMTKVLRAVTTMVISALGSTSRIA